MGFVKRSPNAPAHVDVPIAEEIVEPKNSTFTALVPPERINHLLRYMEGNPWTVHAYLQILNANSPPVMFDPRQTDLTQSYNVIRNLVILTDGGLDYSYDDDAISRLRGSATVQGFVNVNIGDVFIANVDTGEDAIFVITAVDRISINKDTPYRIDYSMYAYVSKHPEFLERLDSRVHQTFYFDGDVNSTNKNVLLTPNEMTHKTDIKSFMIDSQNWFMSSFAQTQSSCLGFPHELKLCFDPIMNSFLFDTMDISKFSSTNVFTYGLSGSYDYVQDTILDNLKRKVLPNLKRMRPCVAPMEPRQFLNDSQMSPLKYVWLDYIMHVKDASRAYYAGSSKVPKLISSWDVRTKDNYYIHDRLIDVPTKEGIVKVPLLPTLFDDDYYIVSKNFYDYLETGVTSNPLSFFEVLVLRYLKKETLAQSDLLKAIQDWEDWSPLHQYYILPVLWLMCRNAIGTL